MIYIYTTGFHLTNEIEGIDNYCEAEQFLEEANKGDSSCESMSYFLMDRIKDEYPDTDLRANIYWYLTSPYKGYIKVVANRELTDSESKFISEFISGQNSDGLGESFEQQDFAISSYDEDEDYSEMCSFDWATNHYELELIGKEDDGGAYFSE